MLLVIQFSKFTPENERLEQEDHLNQSSIVGVHVNFPGCILGRQSWWRCDLTEDLYVESGFLIMFASLDPFHNFEILEIHRVVDTNCPDATWNIFQSCISLGP